MRGRGPPRREARARIVQLEPQVQRVAALEAQVGQLVEVQRRLAEIEADKRRRRWLGRLFGRGD
jgi:hypothetical protein